MLLTGREPDHVTRTDFFNRAAPPLDPAAPALCAAASFRVPLTPRGSLHLTAALSRADSTGYRAGSGPTRCMMRIPAPGAPDMAKTKQTEALDSIDLMFRAFQPCVDDVLAGRDAAVEADHVQDQRHVTGPPAGEDCVGPPRNWPPSRPRPTSKDDLGPI